MSSNAETTGVKRALDETDKSQGDESAFKKRSAAAIELTNEPGQHDGEKVKAEGEEEGVVVLTEPDGEKVQAAYESPTKRSATGSTERGQEDGEKVQAGYETPPKRSATELTEGGEEDGEKAKSEYEIPQTPVKRSAVALGERGQEDEEKGKADYESPTKRSATGLTERGQHDGPKGKLESRLDMIKEPVYPAPSPHKRKPSTPVKMITFADHARFVSASPKTVYKENYDPGSGSDSD